MKIGQTVKNIVKPHIDASTWVGLPFLSQSITHVADMTKGLVIPQQATYQETFEEAMTRLNLTEEDLQRRLKEFRNIQLIFLILAVCAIAYFLWSFLNGIFSNALICLAVFALTCSQLFRYNFWAFQIKQRRLGCTFKQWYSHFFTRS